MNELAEGARLTATTTVAAAFPSERTAERIKAADWESVPEDLDAQGGVLLERLLSAVE